MVSSVLCGVPARGNGRSLMTQLTYTAGMPETLMRVRNLAAIGALAVAWMLSLPAIAEGLGPFVGDRPVQWAHGEIRIGDVRSQVRKLVGRAPDNVSTLYIGESYAVGERWMYVGGDDDPRLLWVEFTHGRVTRVWTDPIGDDSAPH